MPATQKDRIRGCLVTMWRDAESNKHLTEQEIAALREPVWPMSISDPKVTLLREGLKAFSDSVDCILTIDELYDVFSKAEIEKLVQDALFQILDSSPQTVEARATHLRNCRRNCRIVFRRVRSLANRSERARCWRRGRRGNR